MFCHKILADNQKWARLVPVTRSRKMSDLTKEKLVKILDDCLFGWEYKQIEQTSILGTAKLAGFILGACFIDAMAGFYAGIDKEKSRTGSGERFKNFVERYLTKYNKEKLWEDLRCGLVHSYAEGGTYAFTDANKAGFHLNKTPNGLVILNLEDFCADLREGYRNLRNDILIDENIFLKAKKRFESLGIMQAKPVQDL